MSQTAEGVTYGQASPERVALGAVAGCFLWDLNDASGPKGVPNASVFLFVMALLLGASVFRHRPLVEKMPGIALLWAMVLVGGVMTALRSDFYPVYIAQDVGTLLFFALCIWYAAHNLDSLITWKTITWFTFAYCLIAVFAYVAASQNIRPEYFWNDRFDPPYYMLFAALAIISRYYPRKSYRILGWAITAPMLWLALQSGNRTQFALALLMLLLVWASRASVMYATVAVIALCAWLMSVGLIDFDFASSPLQQSRFSSLGSDESLDGRLAEVDDVTYHIFNSDTAAQQVLGRGHGAMWEPITRDYSGGNPYEAFYIHIGPVALAYRYGILGVLFFLYTGWVAARSGWLAIGKGVRPTEKLWLLGSVGFFLNYFFQNSLYDPPAILALAVSLVILRRYDRQKMETMNVAPKQLDGSPPSYRLGENGLRRR